MRRLIVLLVLLPAPLYAEPTTIIHIQYRHYVSPEVFKTDLKEQDNTLTQEQIDKQYYEFLEGLEVRQRIQVVLLRGLIKRHKLKSAYIEGLTEKNYKEIMKSIESLKEYEKTREAPFDAIFEVLAWQDKIELGAAGQLVVKGELETLLVTEDSKAFEAAANPVRSNGMDIFDNKADEKREDAIVRNLLKGSGVVVIVLGEDHDLSDNLKRLRVGVKYKRIGVGEVKLEGTSKLKIGARKIGE